MKREDLLQNFFYAALLSAFLVLYFILSFNNRLAADDYYFLSNFNEFGWWQSMVISWHSWVTRWAGVLWLNSIFILYKLTGNFLFYHIMTLLMLCFALNRLASVSILYFSKQRIFSSSIMTGIADLPEHSRFTVSLVISFFFMSGNIGETFFWITSSSMYLWSFMALCFLIAEVLRGENGISSLLVCTAAAAFVGGAAEAISIPAVLLLSAFFVYQLWKKKLRITTALSIAMLLASVLVSFLGEGRAIRQEALIHQSVLQSLWITLRSLAHIESYFAINKIHWAMLFFIAWMGFSEKIPIRIRLRPELILKALIIYLVACFILIFPSCYLLGEVPPQRTWILLSFLNCACIAVAGIAAGKYLQQAGLLRAISSAGLLMLAVFIVRTVVIQKEITGTYTRALDARMQFLTTLVDPQDSATIILDGLPASGMLTSAEISVDTSDFRNRHLKRYLGIRGAVMVK